MKTKNLHRVRYFQVGLIAFVWILIFSVPVLFGDFQYGIEWSHIFKIWTEYTFVFCLFLINRFLLLPYLFFKNRRGLYFSALAALIALIVALTYINSPSETDRPERSRGPEFEEFGPFGPPPFDHPPMKEPVAPFGNILILSILIIGFDTGLGLSIRWLRSEQNRVELEKENTENKLAFLKNQISPHFFMNTLNNIHSLVDIDTEEAKDAIIKLSHLMSYLLYESQTDKISLRKEIEFIQSYVELMKLRYSDKVKIELNIPADIPNVRIPPLLFISLIENAFKHGISYQNPSYISIYFLFDKTKLYFEMENSLHEKKEAKKDSGIGLENTVNRLELLYKANYDLTINNSESAFNVKLNIPL